MAYFWLNQHNDDKSAYRDTVGEVYHYRSTTPGCRMLSEGDQFVYYQPGDHLLFGAGRVNKIESGEVTSKSKDSVVAKLQPNVPEESSITEFYAHIDQYRAFDPPISARDIKPKISFLRDRTGLNGVPQNSIYKIDRGDFETILREAGEEEFLDKVTEDDIVGDA